jgi:hypothetical protein
MSATEQQPKHVVHQLGPRYFGIWRNGADIYVAVRTSRVVAELRAAQLNTD